MKKDKSSSKPIPIQLSANKKSHSINLKHQQQSLFVPYKIDWKHSNDLLYGANNLMKQPLKNLQNSNNIANSHASSSNSKVFYQNMKNQLLNIKQDVQKMIMKQKKQRTMSQCQTTTRTDSQNLSMNNSNNGCIKTINIKNKCQQKINKVQSLYENVDKALSNKICDTNFNSNKFIVGQSRYQHAKMNNLIEDQVKSTLNFQERYKSEKQCYGRLKSKSITTVLTHDPQNFIESIPFFSIHNHQNQKQCQIQSQNIQKFQNSPVKQIRNAKKQKIELDIQLPSFDKLKKQQTRVDQQKDLILQNLKAQISELSTQVNAKDKELQNKEQEIQQLKATQIKLKTQIQEKKGKYKQELNKLSQISLNSNKTQKLQLLEYQNQINDLRNTLKQNSHLMQQKDHQIKNLTTTITQQSNKILNLSEKLKNIENQIQQRYQMSNNLTQASNFAIQVQQQNSKIKQKLKLKQNQLYIYQQQLKEAKQKIKDLKQKLNQVNDQKRDESNKGFQSERKIFVELQMQSNKKYKQALRRNEDLINESQKFKQEIQKFQRLNRQNDQKIKRSYGQNNELKIKLAKLQEESQKSFQQMMNNSGLNNNIGEELSLKFSQMVDQNYSLKNKNSHLQANLQELSRVVNSLRQQVQIYEEKLKNQSFGGYRKLRIQDWDNLTQQRDQLKDQTQNLKTRLQQTKEFYQVQIMKKQNQVYELKSKIDEIVQYNNIQNSELNNQDLGVSLKQSYHPNIRSIKHITNLSKLLYQFKDMINYNLQMKNEIEKLM